MPICPYCKRNFPKREPCFKHMNDQHGDLLAKDNLDAPQKLWLQSHPSLNGNCVCGCGQKTDWNPKTGKPYRLSNDPNCRKRMKAIADVNMIKVYGKTTLLNDMEQQKKMLSNRHITGTYKFADGGIIQYTGKLEQNFLQFCDKVMEFRSNQILESPESFTYHDPQDNVDRQYIPDYYLPDYNLLVEIKDGNGESNTNPAFVKETKYKVALKDAVMKAQTKYNYIRISGKNYGPFLETLVNIVRAETDDAPHKNLVVITESACEDVINELDMMAINCDNEMIDPNNIRLLITYDSITHTVKSIAITDSRYMSQWYVTDYTDNTSRCAAWDDGVFTNCNYNLYKYAGIGEVDAAKMNEAFHVIMDMCRYEADESTGFFDILEVFGTFGINIDDGKGFSNNTNHMMDFIMIETYKTTTREEDDQ